MTEVKSTPALRFPGFDGEWKAKSLGNICTKIGSGKTPRGGDQVYQTNGIPFIRSQDVNNDILTLDQTHIPASVHLEMKGSTVLPNDILLNITGASIGRSCIVPKELKEANVNQHVSIIRLKEDDPKFLQAILSSSKGQKLVFEAQTGSGREGLNFESIKKFKIRFPSPPEQQKIASFLSAVDNRIQLLKQKKEKLQAYKNGVLQQIFSQQIRFKDEKGNDFPDWEEKKLGELYDFKSTNSFSREKLNYSSGEVKNIHYGDIHTKFRTHFDITQELVPFINTDVDLSRIKEECYVLEGDLIIADASEDTADIGKTIEAVNLNGEKVLAGLHTFLARRKDKTLAVGFAGHLMKSNDIRLQVMKIAQGTKVLSISTGRLANVTTTIPVVAEQQKIASFLTSLDKAIEAVQAQTDRSAEFKKGLLQQLFV